MPRSVVMVTMTGRFLPGVPEPETEVIFVAAAGNEPAAEAAARTLRHQFWALLAEECSWAVGRDLPVTVRAAGVRAPAGLFAGGRDGKDGGEEFAAPNARACPRPRSPAVRRGYRHRGACRGPLPGPLPLVVELGEVGGEGRILKPAGRRAQASSRRSAPEYARRVFGESEASGEASGGWRRALDRDRLAAAILRGRARSAMGDAPSAPVRARSGRGAGYLTQGAAPADRRGQQVRVRGCPATGWRTRW